MLTDNATYDAITAVHGRKKNRPGRVACGNFGASPSGVAGTLDLALLRRLDGECTGAAMVVDDALLRSRDGDRLPRESRALVTLPRL